MEASNDYLPCEKKSNVQFAISKTNDVSHTPKLENNIKLKTCTFFFNNNYCKFGSNCKYEHVKRESRNERSPMRYNTRKNKQTDNKNQLRSYNVQATSKQNCRYYKIGSCEKGEYCAYQHSNDIGFEMSALNFPSQSKSSAKKFESSSGSSRKKTSTPLCRYYKIGSCENGEYCAYQHSDGIGFEMSALNFPSHSKSSSKKFESSSSSSRKKTSTPLCRYFKRGLCNKGDICKFYHQNETSSGKSNFDEKRDPNLSSLPDKSITPVTKSSDTERAISFVSRHLNVYDSFSLTSDLINHLRSTEINQLKKRFPRFEVIEENQTFSVIFQPSDPDWAFDLNKLQLEVDFPINYPKEECKITVVQNAEIIPYIFIKYLNKAIFEWIHGKFEENSALNKTELIFRPFLKWLDKNLEDLFITGLRKVKQDLKAKADGIEFVAVEDLFASTINSEENAYTDDSSELQENHLSTVKTELQEEDSSLPNSSELQQQTSVAVNNSSSGLNQNNKQTYYSNNNATKIIFTDLEFVEGAAVFMCSKISVTLQCCRCKTSFNTKTVPKKNNGHVCTKCSKNVGFIFEPTTVHQFSSVLGNLHLLECIAVDINLVECHFLVDCLNCSKQVPVNGIHYGQKHKMWCIFCNQRMLIFIGAVKFQTLRLTSDIAVKLPSAKKSEKKSKDPLVKEGQPLPDFGACKHYKKSFRWLRFPCCGRLYPCDECHNEKETDHEMKYASRMICGYCSKEQPYSREKPCFSCSQSMTKKSGSHWEGGKGCRNRITMCREDKQKYSGVSKTVSKKAQNIKIKKKH